MSGQPSGLGPQPHRIYFSLHLIISSRSDTVAVSCLQGLLYPCRSHFVFQHEISFAVRCLRHPLTIFVSILLSCRRGRCSISLLAGWLSQTQCEESRNFRLCSATNGYHWKAYVFTSTAGNQRGPRPVLKTLASFNCLQHNGIAYG